MYVEEQQQVICQLYLNLFFIICWFQVTWRVWLSIGTESTKPPIADLSVDKTDVDIFIPSQAFLTALVQIFPALFQHIRER